MLTLTLILILIPIRTQTLVLILTLTVGHLPASAPSQCSLDLYRGGIIFRPARLEESTNPDPNPDPHLQARLLSTVT